MVNSKGGWLSLELFTYNCNDVAVQVKIHGLLLCEQISFSQVKPVPTLLSGVGQKALLMHLSMLKTNIFFYELWHILPDLPTSLRTLLVFPCHEMGKVVDIGISSFQAKFAFTMHTPKHQMWR